MTPRTCKACKQTHANWHRDGEDHTGQIDGGVCYTSWTCRATGCGSTAYEEFDCPRHTAKCKAIHWAYPTSPAAQSLGYGSSGCWVVALEPEDGAYLLDKVHARGFTGASAAVAYALTVDLPWGQVFMRFAPSEIKSLLSQHQSV